MKTRLHLQLLTAALLFLGLALNTHAQTTICEGEEVVFTLAGYTGNVQWQFSSTGATGPFTSVTGLSGDSAAYTPTTSGWYRALVTLGTCAPFYSDTMEIVVHPRPIVNAGNDQNSCTSSGTTLGGSPTASGGTGPYTYAWSPSTGLSSTTVANPLANPTVNTTYNLIVTDANGCVVDDTVTLTAVIGPVASAGSDVVISCGGSTTLSGGASSGLAPYTYAWTPAATLSNPNIANPVASPGGTISYILNVTDANSCSDLDTVLVSVLGGSSGTQTFIFSNNIDTSFVVPCSGNITIEAWGAQGGFNTSSTTTSGLGAYQKGTFSLTPGTRLKILVGEQPSTNAGNGGGGGTFVALTNNTPLIIAGGGGGSSQGDDSANKHGQAGQNGGTGAGNGGIGGTSGNGGSIGSSSTFQSGAGGGFYTNGADGWTSGTGGTAFISGGAGGGNNGTARGGFGGGGTGSSYVVGGGGGGYSGGGSGGNSNAGVGGGGGSFNSGSNPTSTSGVRTGNGQVIITW